MSLFHCVIHLLQFPSMTSTSAAQLSCKFNRRSHTRSRSGFIQDENTIESNHNLEDMKPKEEPKKPSNGSSLLKEKVETYKECRKNHAANIGGYAVDGCREFMPAGEEGTSAAFKCAACSCHRNFHRREIDNDCYSCDCSSISTTPK